MFQYVLVILNIMLNNIVDVVCLYAYRQMDHLQEVLLTIQQENACKDALMFQIITQIIQQEDASCIAQNNH